VLAALARGAAGAPAAEAAAAAEAGLGVLRAALDAPGARPPGTGAFGAAVQLQARAGQWGRALAVHELMCAQARARRPAAPACRMSSETPRS